MRNHIEEFERLQKQTEKLEEFEDKYNDSNVWLENMVKMELLQLLGPAAMANPFVIRWLFGKEAMHTELDIISLVPAAGTIAELVNAGFYFYEGAVEGDKEAYGYGVLSLVNAIPFAGDIGIASKYAIKGSKYLKELKWFGKGEKVVQESKNSQRVVKWFEENNGSILKRWKKVDIAINLFGKLPANILYKFEHGEYKFNGSNTGNVVTDITIDSIAIIKEFWEFLKSL